MIKQLKQPVAGQVAQSRTSGKTDGITYLTPVQVAARWGWHVESVRRAIRQRRFEAVVIWRRLLVPIAEVERIEREGRLARAA